MIVILVGWTAVVCGSVELHYSERCFQDLTEFVGFYKIATAQTFREAVNATGTEHIG